ncbi:hypothetical protein F2Q69_00013452 [Brassica cretica]|uniref:Uncharacterized protein n=1 Tax=Brassica cretica TaxID=69181 RepID=A0A8S9R0L9_BRACR|nr:hypothetical protein F2Q69_00013452 [Brassica cretica]
MLAHRDWTSVMSRFTEEVRTEESIRAADSNLSNLSIPSRALRRILFALMYNSDKDPPLPTAGPKRRKSKLPNGLITSNAPTLSLNWRRTHCAQNPKFRSDSVRRDQSCSLLGWVP